MTRFSRRSLLTASVAAMALAAGRGFAQRRREPTPKSPPVELLPRTGGPDVVIVGAGAAGIAAARRLTAAGHRVVVFEAAAQVGGRCVTDVTTFGAAYDRGAHWLYSPDLNPVAKLATQSGLDIYPAPPGQRIRIARRYAREGEMEELLSSIVKANRAIADAVRGRGDVSAAQALPKDLGDWRATIDFMLGPAQCGKDLAEISASDLAHAVDRDTAIFCRQGVGALIAKLAADLPVRLSTPVNRIAWSSRWVEVEAGGTEIEPRAVLITISTNALAAGKIRFQPELPRRQLDAAARLKLGSYDRIALELAGNPLGLRADELVFEKASNNRTAALFANVGGTTLCTVDVGGSFGRELAAKGQPAMVDFALDWLSGLFGTEIKNAVKRRHATNWNEEPWILGAMSVAAPGAQTARKTLMEPINNRIWFAGEAVHETLWGTVGGAWESGERAADALSRAMGRR